MLTAHPARPMEAPLAGGRRVHEGLDLRTWLTIVGVFVVFFGLPALALLHDRRKELRRQAGLRPHDPRIGEVEARRD